MSTESTRRVSIPLAARIFLLSALLIIISVGAAVFVSWQQGGRQVDAAIATALSNADNARQQVENQRLESVQLTAQLLSSDPDLVRYMSTALGGDLGMADLVGLGGSSVEDLLLERREALGFDVGIVLDPNGNVEARTDQREAYLENLGDDPFFAYTIDTLEPVSGFWRSGARLYQAALVPLAQAQDLVGFLLIGVEVDTAMASDIGRLSDAEIFYWLPGTDQPLLAASSLGEVSIPPVRNALAESGSFSAVFNVPESPSSRVDVEALGQRWAGSWTMIPGAEGEILAGVFKMTSADDVRAGFRDIQRSVLLAGLVVMLFALVLSFAVSRRILRPVTQLSLAAERAAEGDYDLRISVAGGGEIERMSRAFNSLLSDLREKRDYQGYMANLTKLLPSGEREGGGDVGRTQTRGQFMAPRHQDRLLLGLAWREPFADPYVPDQSSQVFVKMAERMAKAATLAKSQDGSVVGCSGYSLILSFSGPECVERALFTARRLLQAEDPSVPAMALAAGKVTSGSVRWSDHGDALAAMGAPVAQLERLLTESGPGDLLIPKGLGEALSKRVSGLKPDHRRGQVSGRNYFALSPAHLAMLPEPSLKTPPGDAATVVTPSGVEATASGNRLELGSLFGKRYEIVSVLGEGGMGVVYKARDIELDDLVALKTLRGRALTDPEHLERLKSELKLARKITHPNVLRTFDFGDVDGTPFISMEYVRGMTLRYLIKQSGQVPYSAGLRIARQLVAGLDAAHEVGVLHRDIKPENLILEQNGNAKLMDFGIARPIRRIAPGQTEPGMFIGTPHYSSPEQLAGNEVDARTDIYAVGVVLCEMFCGRLPFDGSNTMEIYVAQTQGEPLRPSEYWPDIPAALEELILVCLDRDPAKRFQSAAELSAELSRLRA